MTKILATCAVVLAVLTSIAFNLRYGWSLGDNDVDRALWMALSLAADGVKCTFLALALTCPLLWQRITLRSLWLVGLAYSLVASVGAASLTRDNTMAPRLAAAETRARAQADFNRADAALRTVHASPVWTATIACTRPTKKDATFCTKAGQLQAELSAASRQLANVSAARADPLADSLGRLLSLDPQTITSWLPIFIALVAEFLSAFGFYAIATVGKRIDDDPAPSSPPAPLTHPPPSPPRTLAVTWPPIAEHSS